MMGQVFWSATADAILYAGVAATLCLTSREFSFYNLAAGAWVIVGGWLTAWTGSAILGWPGPAISGLWFFGAIALVVAQVAAPAALGESLRRAPLIYLLVSLGVALVLSSLGPAFLLEASGSTISVPPSTGALVVFGFVITMSVVVPVLVFRQKTWATTVLLFRTGIRYGTVKKRTSLLVLVEVGLLLLIGASGFFVHKGIFGSAEYRTIIPILALVAAKSRPVRAAVTCFLVVMLSYLVVLIAPSYSQYSHSMAIALLLIGVVRQYWPRTILRPPAQKPMVPGRVAWPNLLKQDYTRRLVIAGVVVTAFSVALLILGELRPFVVAQSDILAFSKITLMAVVGWVIFSRLGILSLAWPMIGVVPIYLVAVSGRTPALAVAGVAAFLVCASGYLLLLRHLPVEPALLTDLGVVVCIHQLFKSSPALSGQEEVIRFAHVLGTNIPSWVVPIALALLVCGVLGVGVAVSTSPRVRILALAVADFRFGLLHGSPAPLLFVGMALGGVILAVAASGAFHLGFSVVSTDEMSVAIGMIVLLLSYLMERFGVLFGVGVCALVYGVLGGVFAGAGPMLPASIGVVFVVAAYLLRWRPVDA